MKRKLFSRNFTLLVLGQISSLFGNYILRLALSMYVLEVTGSAAVFAGILSAATIPTILLSPLGGILADRADKRKVMVALDALTGTVVLCVAALLSGGNAIAVISLLLVALSVLGAFETPTVQACIPQMLSGDDIVRGNAVVNQVASVSYLTAPMLGGVLYVAFGLKPVMDISVVCFFITASFECFIRLRRQPMGHGGNVLRVIRHDFIISIKFMAQERTDILKLLLLAALSRFFVMGVTLVGLPFLVRMVLGLDAKYYGGAESALAVATILGSAAAGLLTGKLKTGGLSWLLAAMGLCMIPAGAAFLLWGGGTRRFRQIYGQCGCFLRHADCGQHLFRFCGVPDTAEYAGGFDWKGDGLHICRHPVRPVGRADGIRLFVRRLPGSGFSGADSHRRCGVPHWAAFLWVFRKMESACQACGNQTEKVSSDSGKE